MGNFGTVFNTFILLNTKEIKRNFRFIIRMVNNFIEINLGFKNRKTIFIDRNFA